MKIYIALHVREDWSHDIELFSTPEAREEFVQKKIDNPYNPKKHNYYIYEEKDVK